MGDEGARLSQQRHDTESTLIDATQDPVGVRVLHLSDLLYPQYDYKFPTVLLSPDEEAALIKSAKLMIKESASTAVEPVHRRWQEIAAGHFPPFVLDQARIKAYAAHVRRWNS